MGTITVPGNPYQGGVTPNAVRGLGTLHAMPDSKWRTDKLVAGATDKIVSAVDKWQAETDKTLVQDAINQSKSELEDLKSNPEEGWGNLTGSNALNRPDGKSLSEEYLEKGRALFANRRGQLKTDRQRKMYDLYSQAAYQQLGAELQSHMVKQQAVFEKATHAATFNTATNDVLNGVQSGDMDRANSGYAVAMSELQWQADKSGLPVDVPKLMDTVNSNAIGIFIEGKNLAAARAWLKAHKDDMSAEQVAKSEKLIKAGQQKQDIEYLVEKVLATSGSDSDILKATHEATKGTDADVRQGVTVKVRQALAAREWEKRTEASDLVNTAYKALDNNEELPVTLLQRLDELDPEKAAKVRDAQASRNLWGLDSAGVMDFVNSARTKEAKALGVKILKERESDPIGVAMATNQYGITPLNWQNTDELKAQLQKRVEMADAMAKDWQVPQRLFSKQEAAGLVTLLDSSPIETRVALLKTIADTAGPDGIRMVSGQLKGNSNKYAIAMAGFDIVPGDGGMTAGEMYLRGLQLISDKQVKIDPAAVLGTEAMIKRALGESEGGRVKGLYSEGTPSFELTAELAKGIYAYQAWAGSASPDSAVAAAVGGDVVTYNRRKTILPKGISSVSALNDLVMAEAVEVRKMKGAFYAPGLLDANGKQLAGTPEEIASRMTKMDLQPVSVNREDGSVTYRLIANGEYVYTPDLKPYEFNLVKPPKDDSLPFYQFANGGLAIEGTKEN